MLKKSLRIQLAQGWLCLKNEFRVGFRETNNSFHKVIYREACQL